MEKKSTASYFPSEYAYQDRGESETWAGPKDAGLGDSVFRLGSDAFLRANSLARITEPRGQIEKRKRPGCDESNCQPGSTSSKRKRVGHIYPIIWLIFFRKRPGGAVSRAHHPPTGEWALPPAYTLQLDAAFTPTQRAPIRKEHPSFPFLLLLLLLPAAHSNPPPPPPSSPPLPRGRGR